MALKRHLTTQLHKWKSKSNRKPLIEPTWQRIVVAVRAKAGGRDPSLAEILDVKYCGKTALHSENPQNIELHNVWSRA